MRSGNGHCRVRPRLSRTSFPGWDPHLRLPKIQTPSSIVHGGSLGIGSVFDCYVADLLIGKSTETHSQ